MIENTEDTGSQLNPKLATIRGLLAKAQGTDNEQEREAFNAKAADLSAKYGVDMAMAAAAGAGSKDELCLKEFEMAGEYGREQMVLLYYVLEGSGCKCCLTSEGLTAIGFVSDLERGELLYTSLLLQMVSSVENECPSESHNPRAGWMNGFSQAVGDKLRAAKLRAQQEAGRQHGTGKAEVALRTREQLVMDAFKEEFPEVGARNLSTHSGGYAAGQRASVGGPSVGGQGRRAIG